MLRVVGYCRVSTDKEDQQNSLRSQELYFRENHCRLIESFMGYDVECMFVGIYADEGLSGTQARKRPDFMRMMKDANDAKFDIILTKEISRFARNTVDSLQYTRQLKTIGVGVIFINDNINTLDADAELRLTIMSSIAQEEVRKTSERVKWGQKRRMEQGVVFGNGVYGYDLEKGKLSINEAEAEVVRLIYHKFLNEGKGTHVIARELREQGYASKYRKEWSSVNILNIIRNEKYCGDLLQKKEYTPNYLDHKKIKNNGGEEKVYIKDHHQPIVERSIWEKAQQELRKRSPSKDIVAKYSNRYWCSGKIECSCCGSRFIQKTNKRKYGIYKVWVCSNQSKNGSPKINQYGQQIGCNNNAVNNKTLTHCMRYAITFMAENDDGLLADVVGTILQAQIINQDVDGKSLTKKIEHLKEKKEKVVELYASGVLEIDEIKRTIDKYNNEIKTIEKQLMALENGMLKLKKQSQVIQSRLNSMSIVEQSEDTFKDVLDKIIVHKECLNIKFKDIPFLLEIKYETKGVKSWYETIIKSCKIK